MFKKGILRLNETEADESHFSLTRSAPPPYPNRHQKPNNAFGSKVCSAATLLSNSG